MNYYLSFIIVVLVLCVLSTDSIRVTKTRCEEADRDYCLNGSTCLRKTLDGNSKYVVWCKCMPSFYGKRCQYEGDHLQVFETQKPETQKPHRPHHPCRRHHRCRTTRVP